MEKVVIAQQREYGRHSAAAFKSSHSAAGRKRRHSGASWKR